ncbi:MAG: translation initiation factor IF-2 [Candidatus Dormibacteraeota bacterium]|uniref:Translation initiation factor IF-2 n=1 Tax=Candidatus Dormiibacter inghamiae TaxID=3127013 RepID=A0A934N7F4_9BACT|nr:translation initiation factor IF-2 [Candidatus Dormibacteraeota bacterium]MBJ7607443.1 translation initiation factor IF-2 [Candidatus Dormibacteraeota bacterium]
MKAHELARELNISHKELLNFLQQRRLTRNPSAPLMPKAIDAARGQFRTTTTASRPVPVNGEGTIVLPPAITVKDLADKLAVAPPEIIKKLLQSGVMATLNQALDYGTAEIVADDFGYKVEPIASEDLVQTEAEGGVGEVTTTREELFSVEHEDPAKLRQRSPIVTVLGHVDHGKTSILDAIRKTDVAGGEAGGITQRIGAYKVQTAEGGKVVFIDTPGHEAFTAMRARGASVTDVAVLVVAADDGVMPQTVEAIQHARAADVPIVVAINKIDKENANIDRVHAELAEQGLVTRHYGGEHECVHVSARSGEGLADLLTTILLSSEILDLKANPDRPALGTVVDANLERGRGPVATILVQNGTLKIGDPFVCGHIYGRVRALSNDRGESVFEAGPATPVLVSGLSEVPSAGDIFQVAGSEKTVRQIALAKLQDKRAQEAAVSGTPRLTLEELARRAKEGEVRDLNLVVKADAQGTLEAVLSALQKIEDPVVSIKVVGQGVGPVNEPDVLLAGVSSAIILGFNIKSAPASERAAEREKVEIRYYDVIYQLTEDVERAAKGLREPTYRQVREGRLEVVMPIRIPRLGLIAGCRVVEGKVSREGLAKVLRGREQVWEGKINSLKHYKDDVREMTEGQECGVGLVGFDAFQAGDVLETYRLELEEI